MTRFQISYDAIFNPDFLGDPARLKWPMSLEWTLEASRQPALNANLQQHLLLVSLWFLKLRQDHKFNRLILI